jgi:uncharacterized DUF497 family protein
MNITFNDLNLKKHNISKQEIYEVLDSELTTDIDLPPSIRGNDRCMFIGLTLSGRLLEIGVEFFKDNQEHIFHANDAV